MKPLGDHPGLALHMRELDKHDEFVSQCEKEAEWSLENTIKEFLDRLNAIVGAIDEAKAATEAFEEAYELGCEMIARYERE